MTDPGRGQASEDGKLELARQAVSIWWYLFGELLLWAQSHLAGYEIRKSNPKFIDSLSKKLGCEITVDSHVLEYIGLLYSWNHVNADDPMMGLVDDAMTRGAIGLSDINLRALIRELITSRSANSSFWRFELQSALYALNLGHVDDLARPASIRRQGDPVELEDWKVTALRHVYFRMGKGIKKYRALQEVAETIGQSSETLRSWEKAVQADHDLAMFLEFARLAGELESELDKRSEKDLVRLYGTEYHRHTSDIEYARSTLKLLRSRPLERVREGLRRARTAKRSGM
jgi:hypothetical protein